MAIFQIIILRKSIENVKEFGIGIILVVIGLHLFLKGTNMSLIPLGDSVEETCMF